MGTPLRAAVAMEPNPYPLGGKGSWPWESLARILPSRRWTIDLADLLHVHGAREQDRKQYRRDYRANDRWVPVRRRQIGILRYGHVERQLNRKIDSGGDIPYTDAPARPRAAMSSML